MKILHPGFHPVFRGLKRLLVCAGLVLICGCRKHDTTSAEWHPVDPVGFTFDMSNDGVYKVSAGLPVGAVANLVGIECPIDSLGVFTLGHTFDLRQDATYIVIRNKEKGIDQVFQVGVRGYVELDLSGKHKLRLSNDGENKFVIEDLSSDEIQIKFYPQGEERANVHFNGGADFVFLTDDRLHIQYPSLSHLNLNGAGYMNSLSFKKDDSISLRAVDSVVFKRDFQISQMTFNWKTAASTNEEPLIVDLPLAGGPLLDEVTKFESTLNTMAPGVQFKRVIVKRKEWHILTAIVLVAIAGISFVLMLMKASQKGCLWIISMFFVIGLLTGSAYVCLLLWSSDHEYWRAFT